MIPIFYEKTETSFLSNGKGCLAECISCTVTEELNGVYECAFQYPVNGPLYEELIAGGVVGAFHDDSHDLQPFDIYRYSAPIDGVVTFNARHISYRMSKIVVMPFTAVSCADAVSKIPQNSTNANPFTFWTDKSVSSPFSLTSPKTCKALLCGEQGSILDTYGKGEYLFDKFSVKLYVNRGVDSGVTVMYRKNISNIERVQDAGETFNAIVPYWIGSDGDIQTIPEGYVAASGAVEIRAEPMDFSSDFQEKPSEQDLRDKSTAYLENNTPWVPSDNVTVSFVQLWQTENYKDVAALQRVNLADTVSIYFPELGIIKQKQKVVKVVYDVLRERYESMEIGKIKMTYGQVILQEINADIKQKADVSFMRDALSTATEQITGGLGGYVVTTLNASNQPQEILIMDTDSVLTAVNVIRINRAGIGFSTNGYNGPFNSAWTIDGTLDMAQINVVNLSANIIRAGLLADALNKNSWNLDTGVLTITDGVLTIKDANGNIIFLADSVQKKVMICGWNASINGFSYTDPQTQEVWSFSKNGIVFGELSAVTPYETTLEGIGLYQTVAPGGRRSDCLIYTSKASFSKAVLHIKGDAELSGDVTVRGGKSLVPIHVVTSSFSSLPYTYSDARISANMRVFNPQFGSPDSVPVALTCTITDGSFTLSGTITGATTFSCDLMLTD